jgi:Cdc6-like AAA superfamily ATPase
MNAVKNPFSPGAGSPPPEMVGREGILDQARILLGRVKEKRLEKSILLTGLRGVGKTVLLKEIERLAAKAGYRTVSVEAHEDKSLAALLVSPMRTLLFELDRIAGAAVGRSHKVPLPPNANAVRVHRMTWPQMCGFIRQQVRSAIQNTSLH